MTDRETIIELVSRLPQNMPFEEIAREISFLAGINKAREQARRSKGIPAEEACKLVDSWVSR